MQRDSTESVKSLLSNRSLRQALPPIRTRSSPLRTERRPTYTPWRAAVCFRFHMLDRNTGPEHRQGVEEGWRISDAVPMTVEEP